MEQGKSFAVVEMTAKRDTDEQKLTREPDEKSIEDMSREELLDYKIKVDAILGSIKTQIDKAKSEAAVTGTYADRKWFRSANSALRYHGVRSQHIQARLGALKSEQAAVKREKGERDAERFVRVARARLSDDDYLSFWRDVDRLREKEEG